jgi:chorismate mutase/prephenate dehydratase
MKVIRSRPVKNENWQYYFYTEVEGDLQSEEGKKMMTDLLFKCSKIKIVGTYAADMKI